MEQVFHACLILIPFGIALRMSLRLLYGARGPQVGDPIYQVLSTASWSLTIIPTLTFVVIGTSVLSWFVLIVTAIAGLEFVLARRAMQRRAVWRLLAGAIRAPESEVTTLLNHQARFSGIVGRAYRKLVGLLEQGTDLRQAVAKYRNALPLEAHAYVAIDALSVGGLSKDHTASSLRRIQEADETVRAAVHELSQRYAYLSTVLVAMGTLLSFFFAKIIPSFNAIFADFELELPEITQWLVALSNVFSETPVGVFGLLVFVGLLFGGILIGSLYLCDVYALRPITDRIFFSRHRSQILRLLAIAAERGQSFYLVFKNLTEGNPRYPSSVAIRRMRRVQQHIGLGSDWKYALLDASIIKSADIPMLETAQNAGNLPWVLRMLADEKTRSMIFRWTAIEKVFFPLQVFFLGAVVMVVCVALFLPLVMLINGMTG